ncbi:MAG: hypothetical protein JWQ78_687 [Sediminibacterium sp.]|nr:hypothetical protein [Sediminibacterium sp.]
MEDLKNILARYRALLEKGDNMSVIELFYADNIIQVENDEAPIEGKAAILELEKANLARVNSFHQEITSLLVDEEKGTVMGEMRIAFDSKKSGAKKLNEAFVQQWVDGKIVHQKFYYKSFIDGK